MHAALSFPDIGPNLVSFTLFGVDIALRWYALAYIVGILLGWRLGLVAVTRAHLWPQGQAPMTRAQVDDYITWAILGIILGGRLGFVLFYQPGYYLANPGQILAVWQGGMSFHGGLLGVVIASWIYAARHGLPRRSLADLIALCVPAGLLLGRVANFINAELWGRPTDLPWGVIFPGEAAQDCPGVVGLCARHPSQLYEGVLEGLVLGLLLIWMAWRRGALRRPGLIAGTFFAGYGLARFAVEFVRQPDEQFISPGNPLGLALHVDGFGLTMGQLLSLPMLALGLWLILSATAQGRRTRT
ncbi:MAG: prolipoprotein diacylglyceryl transferase [Rhodobacteraceae bacterium]|nr:MAG: prolipoprotein diacylglyceryl transferase [Paracoccaceae bacterium]